MSESKKLKNQKKRKLKEYFDGNADTPVEFFILFVIIVNCVSLGLETSPAIASQYGHMLFIIDQICLGIFIVELIFKIIAYNKDFFKGREGRWNAFDFIIVTISIVGTLPYFTVFRVLRILRSVRVLRAIKSIRAFKALKLVVGLSNLQRILQAIVSSIPSILWTCVLLLIFYYVYAILGTNFFGLDFPEYFGTLGISFLTLFQMMTFDSWFTSIARPVIDLYGWAWTYFVSFALISAFTLLNVIVGIIVDSIETEGQKDKKDICLEDISRQLDELQRTIEAMTREKTQRTNPNDSK